VLPKLRSSLAAIVGRGRLEHDMDDEMRFHMEVLEAYMVRSGVPANEAKRRARAEFGSVMEFKDECRDARGLSLPDEIARNCRYAFRFLRKSPAFTLTSVVTIALCIGANTAIFSVADAVLFRPLPYRQPEQLGHIVVNMRSPRGEGTNGSQDGTGWQVLKQARSIDLAATGGDFAGVNLAGENRAIYIRQQRVTAGYFKVLGMPPVRGREFNADEDRVGGPAAVVLSHSLWERVFGADPQIIGKRILLRGEPHTVVGIAQPEFRPMIHADVWTPLRPSTTGEGGGQNYAVIGRIRPSATWEQAKSEIQALGAAALQNWKYRDTSLTLGLMPLQDMLGSGLRTPLYILLAAVGVVLLIGCVNVAGLLMARSAARTREIGTRLALGGGRGAVLRQLMTESLVLGCVGGLAGIAVGYAGIAALQLVMDRFEVWQSVRLDGRVLLFAFGASLLTSLLFGLAPAWQATRVDIRSALTEGGSRGIAGGRSHWTRKLLVVCEVALGVVLLVGAGLLVRTLLYLQNLEPGFDGSNVLVGSVSLQDARYKSAESVSALFNRTLDDIRRTPGVESAAVGLHVPYERWLNSGIRIVDGPGATNGTVMTTVSYVTSDYFRTLRIPLRGGRVFNDRDGKDAAPVAIVNQAFANRYLKNQPPVGSHVQLGNKGPQSMIVGVVGDVQERPSFGNMGRPMANMPAVFIPVPQFGDAVQMVHVWFSPKWIVRSSAPQQGLIAAMQHAVEAADPLLPFVAFKTFDSVRNDTLGFQRITAMLLGSLAGLALLLAAVGIYGLIANSVAERTRELGIRMTLGATVRNIIIRAAAPGVSLSIAGVLIGSAGAAAVAGIMKSLLYGVQPTDKATFVAVAAGLVAIALIASLIPSLRLVRLDPARTLREE
jgi:predicted permease